MLELELTLRRNQKQLKNNNKNLGHCNKIFPIVYLFLDFRLVLLSRMIILLMKEVLPGH